jgi:mRNA interferase RelE/StbE
MMVVAAIEELAKCPRPRGVEKLKGYPAFFRWRVGDFRIAYAIPKAGLVVVCLVKNRDAAYKGLDSLGAKLAHAMMELALSGGDTAHVRPKLSA